MKKNAFFHWLFLHKFSVTIKDKMY